ncbi:MAG: ABC transporter permease [Magnetovibrionaceae bacterium]
MALVTTSASPLLAWKLARRELREGLKGFRLFIGCLAIGVAAIAGVGTVSEAVVAGLQRDARALLGGDVEFRLMHRQASEDELAWINRHSARYSKMIEMRAMARPTDGGPARSMIEIKAVDDLYPLAGQVRSDPELPLDEALAVRDGIAGVIIDPSILRKLEIDIGDRVSIGEATYEVRAAMVREPDEVGSVFNFGPRAMIHMDVLAETGLLLPGARIEYHYRLETRPGETGAQVIEEANEAFPNAGWRARSLDNASPGAERFIERMTLFLNFVGLTALLVGGIGVGNAVRAHLDGRIATIATLKCLGAPAKLISRLYLSQVMVLALLAVVVGMVVGVILPNGVISYLQGRLPVDPVPGLYPSALALAGLFGMAVALTFTLWPLARARRVPAATLFRDRIAPEGLMPKAGDLIRLGLGVGLLAVLVLATASDKGFALWFILGAIVAMGALSIGARLIMRFAKSLGRPRHPGLRMALGNIHRRGTGTPSVVMSIGLGLAVLVAVALIEGNLSRQVSENIPAKAPAFFFVDIQPGQVEAFDSLVAAQPGAGELQRRPSLRGRIVEIDGVPAEQVDVDPDVAWALRGDRGLTYTATQPEGSVVVEGEWWAQDYAGPPMISFDAKVARGFGVGVGDTLTINILGRDVEAEIANLRDINWRSLRFDFAVIFSPGTLEGAPHTHIAALQATEEGEDGIERAVADEFGNISVIRVRDALAAASDYLNGIGTAVRGTAMITLVTGALVLAGAIAATRQRRLYDSVVFKVLGATRPRLLQTYLLEYGLLGLFTGLVAGVIGTMTAWAVIVFLMEAEWIFLPSVVAAVTALCISVTLAVGFLGTWTALGEKAAPHLRNE